MSESQEELEKPAKVYQLNALNDKMIAIDKKLDQVLTQTASLITNAQLIAMEEKLNTKIDNEVELIHEEYKPLKSNFTWLSRGVIMAFIIALISQGYQFVTYVMQSLK